MPNDEIEESGGLSRRDMLKRGAIIGGAVVWTAPIVQSMATPAYAAGSPPCEVRLIQVTISGGVITCTLIGQGTSNDPECCRCLADPNNSVLTCQSCDGSFAPVVPPVVISCT